MAAPKYIYHGTNKSFYDFQMHMHPGIYSPREFWCASSPGYAVMRAVSYARKHESEPLVLIIPTEGIESIIENKGGYFFVLQDGLRTNQFRLAEVETDEQGRAVEANVQRILALTL